MITKIVVGSGAQRTVIGLPRDSAVRKDLARRLTGWLFPNEQRWAAAHQRGSKALAKNQTAKRRRFNARRAAA